MFQRLRNCWAFLLFLFLTRSTNSPFGQKLLCHGGEIQRVLSLLPRFKASFCLLLISIYQWNSQQLQETFVLTQREERCQRFSLNFSLSQTVWPLTCCQLVALTLCPRPCPHDIYEGRAVKPRGVRKTQHLPCKRSCWHMPPPGTHAASHEPLWLSRNSVCLLVFVPVAKFQQESQVVFHPGSFMNLKLNETMNEFICDWESPGQSGGRKFPTRSN